MKTRHFVFLLVEEFSHIALACAVEPLRIANLMSGKDLYSWSYASENGTTATCSNGTVLHVHHALTNIPRCDQLLVLSGINVDLHVTSSLLATLRRERSKGTPLGALCSGAYILAKAGFLNGVRTAVHWEFHDSFVEEFPDVSLVRNVFVADDRFITASGGTATADLMLHLIDRDHGYDLSLAVSDQMVYSSMRDATCEQRLSVQARNGVRNDHLAKAIDLMRGTLDCPLSTLTIARSMGISSRQLERLFGRYLNSSPKKYYMELRLQRARHLLMQTEKSLTEIAVACGFQSTSHFSRVYRSAFGIAPGSHKPLCEWRGGFQEHRVN